MNTRMKILMAGALVAAASSVSSQAADRSDTSPRSDDKRITNDVVNAIANDSRLPADGKIEVETERGDVTLTGRVTLPGQAREAGEDAASVDGVRDVDNIVKPLVGENF